MKLYEKSVLVNLIETKILELYPEYYPQGQYNSMFIKYFYQYLRDNTYSGKHNQLLRQFLQLKDLSSSLTVKEDEDRRTYTITDDKGISDTVQLAIADILRNYNNYKYLVKSPNRIVVQVLFGWLPPNAGSWLNLLTNENIIDYYIDGITLVPNTHSTASGVPDSGYVCYKIDGVYEYDTILFLINTALDIEPGVKFTFASLLNELRGSEGATLNRIVTTDPVNAFYEIGPYSRSYISAEDASLIIQVPYNYTISEALYVFDVGHSVTINNKNDEQDVNAIVNWFVPMNDISFDTEFASDVANFAGERPYVIPNSVAITNYSVTIIDNGEGDLINADTKTVVGNVVYESAMFNLNKEIELPIVIRYKASKLSKNNVNENNIEKIVNSDMEIFNDAIVQYVLGDFIWKTSDSKLIAYAQNLVNALFPDAMLIANGVWSDELSNYVIKFKKLYNIDVVFDDDVIDKSTEYIMINQYKTAYNKDPNLLFNEW